MKIAHSESQRKFPHISFISGSRIRESAAVEYGQKSKLSAGTERQYHTNKCYTKDMCQGELITNSFIPKDRQSGSNPRHRRSPWI